jgi:hypothetical protein
MSQAAIAIFIYNRPDHLAATLDSLVQCPGFNGATVYVFADGPKSVPDLAAVHSARIVARQRLQGRANFVFSDVNLGLSTSITNGVAFVLEQHESVIVVEDDLLVSRGFLTYMNHALDHFAGDLNVFQVSGYSPFGPDDGQSGAVLLPWTSTWGWGTWRRAWGVYDPYATGWQNLKRDRVLRRRFNLAGAYDYAHMLELQMAGRRDSWGIRWYWSVFMRGGLVCYPPSSMVLNRGFDGSGTHGRGITRNVGVSAQAASTEGMSVVLPVHASLNSEACAKAQALVFQRNGGYVGALRDLINRVLGR